MRNVLMACLFVAACLGTPASAETIQERVTRELRDQGYGQITATRTLLGRLRFVAEAPGRRREIVLNPQTGEVLRDFARIRNDDDDRGRDRSDRGGTSGSSSSGGGDDRDSGSSSSGNDDDDERDEEDDRDEEDERDEDDEEDEEDEEDDRDDEED